MSASSSYNIPNPSSAARPQVLDKKDFQVIFPQYIDATLTPQQGRRITKTQAVETPTVEEILQALHHFGYKKFVRDSVKSYPRSQADAHFPLVPKECIRVAIKHPRDIHYIKKSEFDKEERESVIADIPNKMELLRRIAKFIKTTHPERPKHPTIEQVIAAVPNMLNPATKTKQKKGK